MERTGDLRPRELKFGGDMVIRVDTKRRPKTYNVIEHKHVPTNLSPTIVQQYKCDKGIVLVALQDSSASVGVVHGCPLHLAGCVATVSPCPSLS